MATYVNATQSNTPPDYDAPGNKGGDLIATSGCMILLTTISVCLRCVSRYVSRKASFGWDDWCALIAWCLLIPQFVFIILSVGHGVGQHQGRLTTEQSEAYALDIFIGEIFYNTGLTAVKFSVLFFYVRVFPWSRIWFRWSIYGGFFLCAGWCIAITFLGSFQCTPAKSFWDAKVHGKCLSGFSVNLGTSIPNVIIDTYILAIPMPFLKGLEANFKQKVGVAIVFFAGYATLALSITRVVVTSELTGARLVDYSWNAVTFLEVVNLEPGIGLISICLPTQVYLFRYFLTEVCGLHWTSISTSLATSKDNFKKNNKRRSEKIRSMMEGRGWRNLSNATTNTSYQCEIGPNPNRDSVHQETIQGIEVQTDVTVRPSSWAPQFVALILG